MVFVNFLFFQPVFGNLAQICSVFWHDAILEIKSNKLYLIYRHPNGVGCDGKNLISIEEVSALCVERKSNER